MRNYISRECLSHGYFLSLIFIQFFFGASLWVFFILWKKKHSLLSRLKPKASLLLQSLCSKKIPTSCQFCQQKRHIFWRGSIHCLNACPCELFNSFWVLSLADATDRCEMLSGKWDPSTKLVLSLLPFSCPWWSPASFLLRLCLFLRELARKTPALLWSSL